jgi:transposase
MRDITRALEDARDDVVRARQRLLKFLLRHGHIFDEINERGQRKQNWTHSHWRWIHEIRFSEQADTETLAYYILRVRQAEVEKKALERLIATHAEESRWKSRVDALRLVKGIEIITAFSLTVEAQVFSRFEKAEDFAAWTGLVPSDHSSGDVIRRGGITKSGNVHVRRLLIESSWHYAMNITKKPKQLDWDQKVAPRVENHAIKATKRLAARRDYLHRRGKKPVVANCATARELAGWVWAIGRMVEGTL